MTSAQRNQDIEIRQNFARAVVPYLRCITNKPIALVGLEYRKGKSGFGIYTKDQK